MNRSRTFTFLLPLFVLFAARAADAGSVTGRVLDSSGKPIAGAKIQWLAYRDDDQILVDQTRGSDPSPLGEIATDAAGRFRIPLEKPGSVALRVLPAGLPSARFVGPFDSTEETDLADIQIPGAARLSGRALDESGKPVPGARVLSVGSEALFESDARILAETRAGADGSFALPDAPEGTRVLLVRAPGFVPVTRIQMDPRSEESVVLRRGGTIRGAVVDAAGKPAAGAVVTIEEAAAETDAAGRYEISGISSGASEVRAIWKEDYASRRENVRVKKGEATEVSLTLARAASITGSVLEEGTRRPVAGARVAAFSSAAGPLFGRRRAERTVRADSRGRFRLTGLAARPYAVEASRDGYLSSSLPHAAASLQSSGSANLALRRAASVTGRAVDENGQPIAGARVRVTQDMNFRRMMQRGPAAVAASMLAQGVLSGPDGSFRLRNVAPARNLELEAAKTGYAVARRPGVTLKPGDAVKDVSLVLRKGLEARGKVVSAQGEPVPGAEIRVALAEGGARAVRVQMRLMGMDREKPDAVAGADGSFVVKGLEPGEYTAVVARDGFARKSVASLQVKATGENVWPPISLSAGIAVGGFVRDSAGQAIAGAQILAIDPGSGARPLDALSGPDGRFRLGGLNADRPVMLNVSAAGYAPLQKNVTPPAEDVAVVLKSAGTIRGRVEDSDTKRPVTDFSISRTGQRGGGPFNIQIAGRGGDKAFQSDDGTFELSDVPPGKWTVRATASGYKPADIAGIEVGEGETKEGVVISLKRGGSFGGRVLDSRGTPVANANVSWTTGGGAGGGMGAAFARFAGGAGNTSTTTDADGRYSFDGLSDTKIMVTASHPDYLDVTREVDLSKESSADLVLGTGGSIAGTVVGQDGRTPVPGAQIGLDEEGDARFGLGSADSTRADGSGSFLFEHLQAGRYKLTAQSSTGRTTATEVVVSDGQRASGVLLQMATGTTINGTVSGLPAGRLGGVRVNANATNYSDSTVTDDSGKFTLRDVPSGTVRFNANTSPISGRSSSTTVEIPDASPQFSVEIAFQGTSRLSGRVTRGGNPLGGIFVNANPTGPAAATGGRSSGQTDENGQYALEGLNDGDYLVTLGGQGVSYRKTFSISGDTNGDILLPPVQIRGTITEAGSGEPLDGVTVQAQLQGDSAGSGGGRFFTMKSGVTDSTGTYYIDDVDSGAYQVTARKNEYQAKTQSVTVGGDSASLDFGLSRGEGVSVRVVDGGTGLPLKGINVSATAAGGGVAFQGSVPLDSTGKGEITSLAPGRYAIHFFSDGYAPRTAIIDAPSPLVTLAVTPGGRVEVATALPLDARIVDSSGLPYQLNMWRIDGRVGGAPPIVSWDHFAPGSYQLLVGPAGAERPYPFTVAEGQTTRVEVK